MIESETKIWNKHAHLVTSYLVIGLVSRSLFCNL